MSRIVRTAMIGMLATTTWLAVARGESRTTPSHRSAAAAGSSWETASEEEGTFWQRMAAGARGFFSRTKAAILPRRDPRPQPVAYRSRGRGFGWGSNSAPSERDAPATMKEWMELKRPGD
ncbi:MAG: hypothetical protein K2Y37_02255 [Pirellulales bacterium]|nr:hypothetical protein [Pirellulales bacterium]